LYVAVPDWSTMPRTYHRKTDMGRVPHDAMFKAVRLVREEGLSVRRVAESEGVSKSALSRYVLKYQQDPNAHLAPNYGHSKIFTIEQEQQLAQYLETCSSMFHGLTPRNVRKLAYEMACMNNLAIPQKWVDKQQAGEDWFTAFLKRHPSPSVRSPEATSLARATAFNEHNIKIKIDPLDRYVKSR